MCHPIGAVHGAHLARGGDIDGAGDQDVVATSFMGEPYSGALRKDVGADALTLLEQIRPGEFRRHVLEREASDHPTVAPGDLDGDGKVDIVAGRFRDSRFAGSAAQDGSVDRSHAPSVVWK